MNTLSRIFISCLILFIGACSILHQKKDISHESRVSYLIGQKLILKKDFFLHRYSDTDEYYLASPGCFSDLPISIESYEKSPTNWMNDPEYKRKFGPFAVDSPPPVLGVIRAGTIVEVVRVVQIKSPIGPYVDILVRLPSPYPDEEWSIGCFLSNDMGPNASPTLRTQFFDFVDPLSR